jgi:hypothetical protein
VARVTRNDSTATYLYCVAHGRRPPALGRAPRGLPGTGPVRAIDAGQGLWIVASNAPLARYGAAPVEARLRDLDWVAACATAHEAVVEHVARAATTIPLKLFTLFNTDERAVAHIAKLRPTIDRAVARVSGRQEWGLRIHLDEARARRAQRTRAARATAGVTSGTRFLLLKRQEQQALREALARGRADVDATFEALARAADDARRREPERIDGTRLVLDAAFLLPPRRLAAFRRTARARATRLAEQGYTLTLSGPWPPYNFVGGTA